MHKIPQINTLIGTSRSNQAIIATESNLFDYIIVFLERLEAFASGGVPHTKGLVFTSSAHQSEGIVHSSLVIKTTVAVKRTKIPMLDTGTTDSDFILDRVKSNNPTRLMRRPKAVFFV